jgi:hypothetical protein
MQKPGMTPISKKKISAKEKRYCIHAGPTKNVKGREIIAHAQSHPHKQKRERTMKVTVHVRPILEEICTRRLPVLGRTTTQSNFQESLMNIFPPSTRTVSSSFKKEHFLLHRTRSAVPRLLWINGVYNLQTSI